MLFVTAVITTAPDTCDIRQADVEISATYTLHYVLIHGTEVVQSRPASG